jgi:hypothetical protein
MPLASSFTNAVVVYLRKYVTFNTNPDAPVSKTKLPSVVSAFALINIRLPARLKGMVQEMESAVNASIVIVIFLCAGGCSCAAAGMLVTTNRIRKKATICRF